MVPVDCGTPGKTVRGLTASDAACTSRDSPPGAGGACGQRSVQPDDADAPGTAEAAARTSCGALCRVSVLEPSICFWYVLAFPSRSVRHKSEVLVVTDSDLWSARWNEVKRWGGLANR